MIVLLQVITFLHYNLINLFNALLNLIIVNEWIF